MKYYMAKILQASLASAAIAIFAQAAFITQANAQAGIFEVIHPDVEAGQVEIEVLNGFALDSIEEGEERSVHEIAIGYSLTDHWKITTAIEIANPQGDSAEVEAFEFENLLLLTKGGHHDEDDRLNDAHGHDFTLGFYTALEAPTEGGISEGGVEFGPVIEAELGELEFVGNLFAEVPFADGEDAGLAYAAQLVHELENDFGIGVEAFGEFEGLFGERGEDVHLAGPALYWETELANGHKVEPRVAVLFGLNDESPEAVLSFNLEYKIGQN